MSEKNDSDLPSMIEWSKVMVCRARAPHASSQLCSCVDGCSFDRPFTIADKTDPPMTCGDPTPHEAHTKLGDGRPCDGVEPAEIPEGLSRAIGKALFNVSHLPEWMQLPALGRDMSGLRELVAHAVLSSGWIADVRARARDDEREAWSSWLDSWSSAVSPNLPSVEAVAAALRSGTRPFGVAAAPTPTHPTTRTRREGAGEGDRP